MKQIDHYIPLQFSDRVALTFTKGMRFFADTFFKKRYGHRAVILETVAGVPGMVAGMWPIYEVYAVWNLAMGQRFERS